MLYELIGYFNLTVGQVEKLTTQQWEILTYIFRFGSISPMEAFADLGITKLSTRISEMKVMGIEFAQDYESRTNRIGKPVRFMRYRRAAA
jgi:hypothetical protein